MNPGPVEEAVKVTNTFMDALKREPLSLALVVMNLALLVFFYFLLTTVAIQREREVNLIYEDKKRVNELLSKCVIPDRHTFNERFQPTDISPLKPWTTQNDNTTD